MPMHDWTRVSAGIFHSMHNAWITHLQEALNAGLLPAAYYALGEQRSGNIQADVLTLRTDEPRTEGDPLASSVGDREGGLIAIAEAPPHVSLWQEAAEEMLFYLERQRALVIRHATGDRIVALMEVVSPANKHTRHSLDDFVDKVVAALRDRIHVLVIDPLPPGRHDPGGTHRAVWDRLMAGDYEPPVNLPLTLVSYCARQPITAWIEPIAVGSQLIDMPLFLTPDHYILTPLESTYTQAWSGVPRRWQREIETP